VNAIGPNAAGIRSPTATVIDSQSGKTTTSGRLRGYDGSKKIKGRKRQALVDTEGSLLKVKVHPADQGRRIKNITLFWLDDFMRRP
jgi:putative transposase